MNNQHYEIIDIAPPSAGIRVIHKKVQVGNAWEDRTFYMLTDGSNRQETQEWLKQHYGPPVYCVTWWSTFTSVCMYDRIYTHWKLCE